MYYIYRITNNINGKTYIGQHKEYPKRKDSYMGSGKLIKSAIKKYGKENFTKSIIQSDIENVELANDWEQMFIMFERAKGHSEYNIANGGSGLTGMSFSDEHKERIRQAHIGKKRVFTEQWCKNISNSNKGKKHTAEHNKKISESSLGKKGTVTNKIWCNNGIKEMYCSPFFIPIDYVVGRKKK